MSDDKKPAPVDLFREFATDAKKMDSGVRFPFKSAHIIIGSANTQQFRNAKDLLSARYPTKESIESEEAQLRHEENIAKYVLLGWENMVEPYTFEAAKRALRIRSFREWVMGIAINDDNYRPDPEAVIKN